MTRHITLIVEHVMCGERAGERWNVAVRTRGLRLGWAPRRGD